MVSKNATKLTIIFFNSGHALLHQDRDYMEKLTSLNSKCRNLKTNVFIGWQLKMPYKNIGTIKTDK